MTSSGDDANVPKPRSKSLGPALPTAVQATHDSITTPSPAPGSIVGCWTPDREPDVPGAKFRPVFVLEVLEKFGGLKSLRVAYGTGQNTSAQSRGRTAEPWEMEFAPGEGALRIVEVTKIDFSKVFVLDYTKRFFSKDGKGANYGKIPRTRENEALQAISHAKRRTRPSSSPK